MSDEVNSTLMIIAVGEFSMGILGNAFIGLVNCMDWIKNKKIASIDLVLTSLAISRICLLCIILLDCLMLVLYPDIYATSRQMRIIDFFWTLTNHVSVWFATCLSIFYFFKIANFSHPLFLWMKWRIDRAIPKILLVCSALSVFISLPVTENLNNNFRLCIKTKWKTNLTLRCRENKAQYASIEVYVNLVNAVPLFGFPDLIFALDPLPVEAHKADAAQCYRCRDPSSEAHVGAMKAVISFLLLFIVYYSSFLVATSSYFLPETELAAVIGELVALIYPSSHSYLLILGNNKLRQASERMLRKVTHALKRRKF